MCERRLARYSARPAMGARLLECRGRRLVLDRRFLDFGLGRSARVSARPARNARSRTADRGPIGGSRLGAWHLAVSGCALRLAARLLDRRSTRLGMGAGTIHLLPKRL